MKRSIIDSVTRLPAQSRSIVPAENGVDAGRLRLGDDVLERDAVDAAVGAAA